MAKKAVELVFDGNTATTPYTSYDSTKINLGALIQQDGTNNFAGPMPMTLGRPMEQSTAIASQYPHVIAWSSDIYWIFLADLTTAGATRRVALYTFTKSTNTLAWKGFITLTYPTATAHTIRGMRVTRHTYSTGTVSASGTAVTGSGTAWQTNRYAVGARIGFGSTDPTQISTWYTISAIGSDTSITLSSSAGTVAGGTAFVIEELRVYTSTTNATAANGGLFVAKGINVGDFQTGGTTIAAATTTDNIKAVYWLADATTVLNTAACGLCLAETKTDTSHDIYVINQDAATTPRVYKYNGRAALSGLASGKSTSAFTLRTGLVTVSGTVSQTNGSRIATTAHGPGAGVSCIYFSTTTRICRAKLTDIIDASTVWVSDCMVELPTGSTSTFAATSGITSLEYAGSIDRFIIFTGATRHYVTRYNAAASATFDHVMLSNNFQIDQSLADSGLTPYPAVSAGFSGWLEDGIAVFCRTGTTAQTNMMYIFPLGADWTYAAGLSAATQNRLITPALDVSDSTKFYRAYTNHAQYLGSVNLGLQPEPFRMYYRTNGITDDTGDWELIADTGDLTELDGASQIQFMFEFRMIGPFCIPARLYSVTVVYEDSSNDSHYQPSVANSSTSANRFAWRFATAFGGTVPTLTVKIYDAVTGALLLTDTTTAQASGTFEKSTNDGSSWGSYNTTDKGNETTYIRYTPTSFGTNIKARALITQ
jgi:hypothetical protein